MLRFQCTHAFALPYMARNILSFGFINNGILIRLILHDQWYQHLKVGFKCVWINSLINHVIFDTVYGGMTSSKCKMFQINTQLIEWQWVKRLRTLMLHVQKCKKGKLKKNIPLYAPRLALWWRAEEKKRWNQSRRLIKLTVSLNILRSMASGCLHTWLALFSLFSA